MARRKLEHRPYHPIDLKSTLARENYMKGVVLAIKGMAEGKADERQQILLRDFMLNDLCATYEPSYFPASERDSTFAEGRRYVGLQLTKMIKTPFNTLFPEKTKKAVK